MPEWRITRLRGEFCLTWDEGDIRRRYRLHTQDAKEAARRAPARYAELTRPKGSTVIQKFAKLFGVPFRKSAAWWSKHEFWYVRSGITRYVDDDELAQSPYPFDQDIPF